MDRAIVLYDQDCGFCRWSAERLRAWDRHGALRFEAIQDPDADAWLGGMGPAARLGSWHFVEPGGHVWSAGAATAPLLGRLPGGRPLAALARRFPGVTERLYRGVANHRDQLGRMLGARACSVDPGAR
jgi:predicted DCC family thiol-disulfide oxidoreductase YuxK